MLVMLMLLAVCATQYMPIGLYLVIKIKWQRILWDWNHRYLMTRLSVQVIYLWRHVSSTAPPFILWWSTLEILFGPLHPSSPFIGELRCQAIQMEHCPYIAERTQNAVYIVRCLWLKHRASLVHVKDFKVKIMHPFLTTTFDCFIYISVF
jgi:hypothetical protein